MLSYFIAYQFISCWLWWTFWETQDGHSQWHRSSRCRSWTPSMLSRIVAAGGETSYCGCCMRALTHAVNDSLSLVSSSLTAEFLLSRRLPWKGLRSILVNGTVNWGKFLILCVNTGPISSQLPRHRTSMMISALQLIPKKKKKKLIGN